MGLFDGIDEAGTASTADLAALTRWPVVLVIDARGQSASAAALVDGFARHRADVAVAAVIFNRVGGPAHAQLLRQSIARARPDIAVLGAIPRDPALALPERHLGLVQAREHADLDRRLDAAASLIASHVDLDRLLTLARPSALDGHAITHPGVPPLGQRIAVAMDDAFAFVYPHVLAGWRAAGARRAVERPCCASLPAWSPGPRGGGRGGSRSRRDGWTSEW